MNFVDVWLMSHADDGRRHRAGSATLARNLRLRHVIYLSTGTRWPRRKHSHCILPAYACISDLRIKQSDMFS